MKLTLAILTLLAASTAARASNFFILDAPSTAHVGDTITVKLDLFADDNIFGFSLDLLYPNFLRLDPTGISEQGSFLANGCCLSFDTPNDLDGELTNFFDVLTGPVGAHNFDHVAEFQFEVMSAGSGSFNLANTLLTDDSFNSLPTETFSPVAFAATESATGTPEPATIFLAATGLAAAAIYRARRAKARERAPRERPL
jgi:hypothetical protein